MPSLKSIGWSLGLLLGGLAPLGQQAQAVEPQISGKVGYELRWFTDDPLYTDQSGRTSQSLMFEPEIYWQWNNGDDSLVFKPFIRADQHDSERSHADIRELLWTHVADDYELRVGVGKVFWGVTEFQHLVDVVNQTDGVEDVDGEDKLGQTMVALSLVRDWGVLDLMLLPGFRERSFAGVDGRLRGPLVVDTDKARYESGAENRHIDAVIRWSHTLGDYDVGVYLFKGTNRDPLLIQQGSVLVPFYEQMTQTGVDLQATLGDWLWKFEGIYRDSNSDHFGAVQAGFEYTYIGILDSAADLGLLMEYGWDSRGTDSAATAPDDLFLGSRLTLNDAQSTELLAGIGQSLDGRGHSLLLEASRRLGNAWKLSIDGRVFSSSEPSAPLYALRSDDMVQITLERYF
ncbi:hypothetical protein [Motiliproteus coralliicola]|uniref:hypothetical protein n=1 Tax=Motiliproteus coralliicola TaxID=2283196 RepID=UPI001FB27058|nr:hypothetical protein [Motiliproteus coralliicola]